MARDAISVAGAVAADAPPASDKDIPASPAIPAIGTALFRRLRFEASFACAISRLPYLEQMFEK
jgi:hypothetical protein